MEPKFTSRASLTGISNQVLIVLSGLQLLFLAALLAAPHVPVYNGHMAGAVQASHLPPLQTFWPPFSESPEGHSDWTNPGHGTQPLHAEDDGVM